MDRIKRDTRRFDATDEARLAVALLRRIDVAVEGGMSCVGAGEGIQMLKRSRLAEMRDSPNVVSYCSLVAPVPRPTA